ncbi:MAG TPA: class I SAM-dependent methyltransferase [Gammaproteobacteria bacterium]|nr:class I SAM-dependent methyltransferase [Gammaproteobacteria bacterium]
MNTTTQQANADQIALWNGSAGRGWVEAQDSLDRLFEPFEELLVEAVAASNARDVLDVGCGTGSTTLAAARRVGAGGTSLGVDISEPMIALARERAGLESTPPKFLCADAQTYAFAPASFDLIVSRFGVMFFDHSVRAFANLLRATKPGGGLHVIAWRHPADNPFMTAAERAAAPLLPQLPARNADEPGQFAFADRERVRAILENSGWTEIDIRPLDVECVLPTSELDAYLIRLGPLARVLKQLDEPTRARVLTAVRAAFGPFVHGAEVRFTAACWTIRARAAA